MRYPRTTPVLLLAATITTTLAVGGNTDAGDAVHFKDGMRTICTGRAWEEQEQVFCEYEGGLLSYPKADVDRIVTANPAPLPAGTPSVTETSPGGGTAEPINSAVSPEPHAVQPIPIGVAFYDPRRAQKYWSAPGRGHDSYPEAVAALAKEFDRPPDWVEEHMGDSNDLGVIRGALVTGELRPETTASSSPIESSEFYNPRRANPYRTGPDAYHRTYADAVGALAREFGKPPDWIEAHMGDSNDLERIRSTLKAARTD